MRHKDNLSKFPLLDHGVQIPLLISSGVRIVRRLIPRKSKVTTRRAGET